MKKAAYFIATFLMTYSTIASAHVDETVHVHATPADGNHAVLLAAALLLTAASVFILRRLKRQTQRN